MRAQLERDDLDERGPLPLPLLAGQGARGRGGVRDVVRALRGGQCAAPQADPLRRRRELARTSSARKRLFTRGVLRGTRRAGAAPAPDPIFIVGLPRAGSTLIEQILASHSQVEGTKELPDIAMIARAVGERTSRGEGSAYPRALAKFSRRRTARARRGLPRRTRASSARPRGRSSSTRCRTISRTWASST